MQQSDVRDPSRAATVLPRISRITFIEGVEKTLVLLFFVYFAMSMWPHLQQDRLANLLLLFSEGFTALLVLLHCPTEKVSTDPGDWLLALSVSFLPVFITPMTGAAFAPSVVSTGLMTFGFLLSLVAKLFLSRSFGIVPANRGIKRGGPYGIVRHPIYAGYMIIHAGFLAACPAAWNLMVCGLICALLVRRILAEEATLNRDGDYRAYAGEVRYRLCPGVF